jgi:hypothetical protein
MTTTLTVDLFVSADGFAGSDGLPGYFGYLGPDLEAWIADSAAPMVSIMGRRTYGMLASLPEEHRDEGWEQMTRIESRTLDSHTKEHLPAHSGTAEPIREAQPRRQSRTRGTPGSSRTWSAQK